GLGRISIASEAWWQICMWYIPCKSRFRLPAYDPKALMFIRTSACPLARGWIGDE
ncbi:unnamed protein product, partial [Ilex paraguariensis]